MPYPLRPSLLARRSGDGRPRLERSLTALDRWLGLPPGPLRLTCHAGDLASLAREVEDATYPGLPWADVSLPWQGADEEVPTPRRGGEPDAGSRRRARGSSDHPAPPESSSSRRDGGASDDARPATTELVLCAEERLDSAVAGEVALPPPALFPCLDLLRDGATGVFLDPRGARASLRSLAPGTVVEARRGGDPALLVFEAAGMLSRAPLVLAAPLPVPRDLDAPAQRDILLAALSGPEPGRAFEALLDCGFLDAWWPEIAALSGVDHSKDFHPEGDAWRHTMETFTHRKRPDPLLSLALLLHDAGKGHATESGGKRFDGHAEIGAGIASRFLERLGFPEAVRRGVAFLVRNHMLPAAIPRIPPRSIERTLSDSLMPELLELYRCDELSTFRGPEGYYAACASYRDYLRSSRVAAEFGGPGARGGRR